MTELVASHDGQWVIVRHGATITLYDKGTGPAVAQTSLDDASDVEIVAVGPPAMFLVRAGGSIALFSPPDLECVAVAKLDAPLKISTVTGGRVAMVSPDGKQLRLLRVAGRALGLHALDVGSPIEFAVGLDRNQVLFGLHRKLEVWDAASGRPLLRLQLQLPPAPRAIGAAHGHLWAIRQGGDEVFVYRLSDGRPFRHPIGATIERVISSLSSQILVLVTARGLVRLHCLAHSLEMLELPDPAMREHALAVLAAAPDDVSLVGCGPGDDDQPWRAGVSGLAMPDVEAMARAPVAPISGPSITPAPTSRAVPQVATSTSSSLGGSSAVEHEARIALAAYGAALIAAAKKELDGPSKDVAPPRGGGGLLDGERRPQHHESRIVEPPSINPESVVGSLVTTLGLSTAARRAMFALYGYYLNGERPAIAPLARGLGDWSEILGGGELGSFAMIQKRDARLSLAPGVTELLDGCPPRAIRIVGTGTAALRAGTYRVARDGRSDIEIEVALSTLLGKIGIVTGPIDEALLEARLHGVTAVALLQLVEPPRHIPKGAGLVLVLYGSPSSWVADLPALDATVS